MIQHNPCAAGVNLRHVLPQAEFFGDHADDVRVSSISHDPRQCREGDLFVALDGAEFDAHESAREAIERGAIAILAERILPIPVPVVVVEDARVALGHVCQALVNNPTTRLKTIGITGTNGKTVTSLLVASVLAAARRRVGVMGSLGSSDEQLPSLGNTTPSAPELARWLANVEASGCRDAVMELSSESLARHLPAGAQFDAAIFTNIRRDHLELHGNLDNYRNAKARLLGKLKAGGFAVVNADCPGSRYLFSQINHPVITYGMKNPAEVTAEILERHKSEQTFLLTAGSETVAVRTQMIGEHHVYNCLAAAATGLVLGIDLPTIARGLESLESVPGRLERIECGQEFGVYVDVASTPDTLAAALTAVKSVTQGKVFCVYGMSGEGQRHDRPLLGRVLERHCDRPILTGDGDAGRSPLQIAHEFIDGFQRPGKAHILPDRTKAIRWALSEAQPGDTVLIAGRDSLLPLSQETETDAYQAAQEYLYDDEPVILPFPTAA